VGQHTEPLANDALQRWIREATIQEMNGIYYQKTMLLLGQSTLVDMKPPREVLGDRIC
jgi:hypothetical protein